MTDQRLTGSPARLAGLAAVMLLFPGCSSGDNGTGSDLPVSDLPVDPIYKERMRALVRGISAYAKDANPGFLVIPQNGHDLITEDGTIGGPPSLAYLEAIDGVGREDLFYGYERDDKPTPSADRSEMISFLDIADAHGVQVLVTDYCSTPANVDDSHQQNSARGYLSFAADQRELDQVPAYPAEPFNANDADISALADARNFLYVLNTAEFDSRTAFIEAIQRTNYDLVIIDLFFDGTEPLNGDDVEAMRTKQNGGRRLVVAYMSIGEAEDYRYYWNSTWRRGSPSWLASENPDWPGNYKVRYWEQDWQNIIYGHDESYLARIIDAGFDGVYLDIIDAFEFFEN